MLDCDDVESLMGLLDEKLMNPMDDLLTVLEKHELCDEDGELESGEQAGEIFEDLSSKDQKKVETALRKYVKAAAAGAKELHEELEKIDRDTLDEDEDEESEDDDGE